MATGMLQGEMARPDGEELTTERVSENIQVPPELQEAYERVVIAGMKVMFSEQTHRILLKELQREAPIAERLAYSASGAVLILFAESNQTMPPQVVIPAAVELLMQAVDFVRKSGFAKVTNKDVGDAMELTITTILEKFGGTPDKIEQMLNQFDNQAVDAAAQQMGGAA